MFFLNLHEAMVFHVNFSLSGKVVRREEVVPILRKDAVVSQTSNVSFFLFIKWFVHDIVAH